MKRNPISLAGISRSSVIFGIVVIILVTAIGYEASVLFRPANARPKDELGVLWSGNYAKDRAYWKSKIDEVGTAQAYELFKKDTAGKQFGIAHTLAHIMGELIYEKEGLKGVTICDSAFAFGCYHSFFGKALSEQGIGVLGDLDNYCVEKWGPIGLGCSHRIGHGIMGYLGDDKLVDSLNLCGKLSWKGPIGGCSSGVFMEYNFHTMDSLNGAELRAFDPQKPLYPCDSLVPKAFRQSCYFELSDWLAQTFRQDYAKVGELCATVKDEDERKACFKGLGRSIAPISQYHIAEAKKSCTLMPNAEDELLCRAGAAWSFFAEPTEKGQYPQVCEGLPQDRFDECMKESQIIKLQ